MKKIWIKVIHPAPYTYIWKTATTNLFDIQYYYDFDKSLGKIWDDYNAEKVNKGNSLFSLSKLSGEITSISLTLIFCFSGLPSQKKSTFIFL